MRESLDQMNFVAAAYAVTIIGTLALLAQSWLAMRRAEARRDKNRRDKIRGDKARGDKANRK